MKNNIIDKKSKIIANPKKIRWRLIKSGSNDPYMNMAIDEALIQLMNTDKTPIVRFYDWRTVSISFGYSQKVDKVINTVYCTDNGIPFVRRPTGGGVVFHGNDITYSVFAPKDLNYDIYDVYKFVQSNIKSGLSPMSEHTSLYSQIEKSNLLSHCFVTPNFGDLIIKNRKLGGMAARRVKQNVLCQGYIYAEKVKDIQSAVKMDLSLADKAISLDEIGLRKEDVLKSIITNWNGIIDESGLNEQEEEFAQAICEGKYSTREWNFRR